MKGIGKLFKNHRGIYIFIGKKMAEKINIPNKQQLIVEYDENDNKIEIIPL